MTHNCKTRIKVKTQKFSFIDAIVNWYNSIVCKNLSTFTEIVLL